MTIEEYDYYCPKCKGKLSQDDAVVFDIRKSSGEKAKLYLNPKPGYYDYSCEPELLFDKGELVDFFCVSCHQNLSSKKFEKFIEIALKITDQVFIDVFFSRIHGVHKTYVGIEDFEKEYGDEIRKY